MKVHSITTYRGEGTMEVGFSRPLSEPPRVVFTLAPRPLLSSKRARLNKICVSKWLRDNDQYIGMKVTYWTKSRSFTWNVEVSE